jgi:hypothetical protein
MKPSTSALLMIACLIIGVLFATMTYYCLYSFGYYSGMGAFAMGLMEMIFFFPGKWFIALFVFAVFVEQSYPQTQSKQLTATFVKVHLAMMGVVWGITVLAGTLLLSLQIPYSYRDITDLAPVLLAIPTVAQLIAPLLSTLLTFRMSNRHTATAV